MWPRILKANAAYALGSAANGAALIVLVPLLVKRFSVAEYGLWSLFEVGILLLNMLLLAGTDVGLMREYWFDETPTRRRALAGTVLLGVAFWGAALGVVCAAASFWLREYWGLPLLQASALACGTALCEALFAVLLTLLRIREQALRYVLLASGRMLAFVGFAVVAVVLGGGVRAALAARLLAAIVGVVLALLWTRDALQWTFDRPAWLRVLHYGLPLLPANLAGYVLLASDRYFLERFASLELVACYAFAYKIAAVLDMFVTRPFALDWAPRRFRIASEPAPAAKYNAALLLYVFASSAVALAVWALTPAVYRWLAPPEYAQGQGLVPLLLAAYVISGLSVPLNVGIMLKDQTRKLPPIQWAAATVCTLLNLTLIPRFGMWGAAWATLIAYLLSTAGIAWLSARLYPISYAWGWLLGLCAMLAAGVFGMLCVDDWLPRAAWSFGWLFKLFWVAALCALVGRRLWLSEQALSRAAGPAP